MLTDHLKVHEEASGGLSTDLAFVQSRVFGLGRSELEGPLPRVPLVVHREPPVLGVGVAAHREDVHVPMSHPGHLHGPLFGL